MSLSEPPEAKGPPMRVRRALATGMVCTLAAGTVPAAAQAVAVPAPTETAAVIPARAILASAASSVPAATTAPIPKPGDKGSHVTALQRALIARGHGIPAGATGYFGTQTRSAVASFQRAQGWSGSGADGIPGPQTMARLNLTATPTAAPTSTSTAASPAPSAKLSPSAFVARYAPLARQASASTGVPALVTLAQAALESGWGGSAVGYNFFGIKARPSDPDHTKRLRITTEVFSSPNVTGYDVISIEPIGGGLYRYTVREYFRIYSSAEEAFRAHNVLLASSSRYRAAFQYTNDPYRFAAAVAAGGYATDPSYTSKLHDVMRLIERYY